MRTISVITACYNEEENVRDIYERVKKVFFDLKQYDYEHIFIDDASRDQTVPILRSIAAADKHVKVIVCARNFGHIRAPVHAFYQSRGDAVISVAADGQDPPELIRSFIKKWEDGYKVVMGVKTGSEEPRLVFALRMAYYRLLRRLSDIELVDNFTGFGLYERQVIDVIKGLGDPYPYFRGLIPDLGFESAKIEFIQPRRTKGRTKNNPYTLLDMALLGMTSCSKVPLRLVTLLGFASSALCLFVAAFYFVYKLLFWGSFALGLAPLVVGIFFFCSVQLFFLALLASTSARFTPT